jgi:hypothetical protein
LLVVTVLVSCGSSSPDLAALRAEPAAALRMPDAVDLGHFWSEKRETFEGSQVAFDAHVFGVQVGDIDVRTFYERERDRLGWKPDRMAGAIDSVELAAWGWCKGAMTFRIGIQDQPRAFRPEFCKGQTFRAVFDARLMGQDPALGCPGRIPR